MSQIPDKFLKIKDLYEVLLLSAKVYVLQQKHKDDIPEEQNWIKKLLAKADYLSAVPLVWPAFDNIANCLTLMKVPENLVLLGDAAVELLDMPDNNKEARVEKMVTTFCAFAAATEEAFA